MDWFPRWRRSCFSEVAKCHNGPAFNDAEKRGPDPPANPASPLARIVCSLRPLGMAPPGPLPHLRELGYALDRQLRRILHAAVHVPHLVRREHGARSRPDEPDASTVFEGRVADRAA